MSKYQSGKIYKIVCNITGDIYIGSTYRRLKDRLWAHKSKGNKTCSKNIIDRGDYKIELIEDYPCETKQELNNREGHWQLQIKCINEQREGKTEEEKKQDKKDYRLKNKERLQEYYKQRHIKNKDAICEKTRKWHNEHKNDEEYKQRKQQYRDEHKEEQKIWNREWRLANKEKIKEKNRLKYLQNKHLRKPPVTCECGGTHEDTVSKKKRHESTKLHIQYINSL